MREPLAHFAIVLDAVLFAVDHRMYSEVIDIHIEGDPAIRERVIFKIEAGLTTPAGRAAAATIS